MQTASMIVKSNRMMFAKARSDPRVGQIDGAIYVSLFKAFGTLADAFGHLTRDSRTCMEYRVHQPTIGYTSTYRPGLPMPMFMHSDNQRSFDPTTVSMIFPTFASMYDPANLPWWAALSKAMSYIASNGLELKLKLILQFSDSMRVGSTVMHLDIGNWCLGFYDDNRYRNNHFYTPPLMSRLSHLLDSLPWPGMQSPPCIDAEWV